MGLRRFCSRQVKVTVFFIQLVSTSLHLHLSSLCDSEPLLYAECFQVFKLKSIQTYTKVVSAAEHWDFSAVTNLCCSVRSLFIQVTFRSVGSGFFFFRIIINVSWKRKMLFRVQTTSPSVLRSPPLTQYFLECGALVRTDKKPALCKSYQKLVSDLWHKSR